MAAAPIFGQNDTTQLASDYYKWYSTADRTWALNLGNDTISAETNDTLVIDGDTILTDWPDTVVWTFPNTFADYFSVAITVSVDSIPGEDSLVGDWILMSAPCSDCAFLSGTITGDTLPAVGTSLYKAGDLTDLKMIYRVTATTGVGVVRTRITLKPN